MACVAPTTPLSTPLPTIIIKKTPVLPQSPNPTTGPAAIYNVDFTCLDGQKFHIVFSNNQASLTINGKTQVLTQLISGSGIRYGNENTLMFGKGDDARIEDTKGNIIANDCTANSQIVTTPTSSLAGSTWQLQESSLDSKVAAAVFSSITFDTVGRVNGDGGCNSLGGTYRIDGDKLKFGALVSTLMACQPVAMQQEAWYLKSLQTAMRYEVSGDTLRIYFDNGTPFLTFVKKVIST